MSVSTCGPTVSMCQCVEGTGLRYLDFCSPLSYLPLQPSLLTHPVCTSIQALGFLHPPLPSPVLW